MTMGLSRISSPVRAGACGLLGLAAAAQGGVIFDNFSEGWTSKANLPSARYSPGYATWNDSLYVVGGMNSQASNSVFRYDGGTNWTTCAALSQALSIPGVFDLGGYLYSAGGTSPAGVAQNSVYRYDGTSWTTVGSLPAGRHAFGCAVLNGKAYVIGGSDDTGTMVGTTLCFDGTNWTTAAALPAARYGCSAATLGNVLYLIGGLLSGGTQNSGILKFDGTSWTAAGNMPAWRYNPAVCVQSNKILVIGGKDGSYVNATNVYAFDGTNWTEQIGLGSAFSDAAAGVVSNQLYVAGGSPLSAETRYYRRGSTGVSPAMGDVAGGYSVAIYGTDLGNGADITNVTLCGVPAAIQAGQTATSVVVTAGAASTMGFGDVRVFSASQGETVKSNVFYYSYVGAIFAIYTDSTNWTYEIPNGAAPTSTNETDFGTVAAGQTLTNELAVTENSGNGTLVVGAVDVTGAGAAAFSIEGMPTGLAEWGFSNILVRFTPPSAGVYTASVAIANDGFPNPYVLNLSGTAFAVEPELVVRGTNGATIASGDAAQAANGTKFATLPVGASWTNVFGITNGGLETLTISGFGISDPRFEIAGLPASVAAGGASEFTVRFAPDAAGSFAGTLTISNDSPTAAYVVNLAGSCFAASTNAGPFAGGNAVTFTNGNFGTITNVLVGGVAATILDSGTSGFTVAMPAAGAAGVVNVVVQTSDNGETVLANAYAYNPAGEIGGTAYGPYSWTNLGSGMHGSAGPDSVYTLACDGTRLYAGGDFTNMGGVTTFNVAMWDPASGTWTNLGSGLSSANVGLVYALAHDGTNLYAGGSFTNAGAVAASRIAMWNGTTWTNLGAGENYPVWDLAFGGTNLYCAYDGRYSSNNRGGVGTWNGTTWSNSVASPINFRYLLFDVEYVGGTLYACGCFRTLGGVAVTNLAMQNPAGSGTWAGMGGASVFTLAQDGTNLYVGGTFTNVGGVAVDNIAMWNGSSWTNLGSGVQGDQVYRALYDGRNLYVAGVFTNAGGVAVNNIAMWNGASWTNVGDVGTNFYAAALAHDGVNLYACGSFTNVGGVAARCVAKWGPEIVESSGVSPESGSGAGGYPVVITGTNLGNGADITNVTICGAAVSAIVSQSATQVVVTAGAALSGGLGDVRVQSTSFGETVKSNAFTYNAPGMSVLGTNGAAVASGDAAALANGTKFATLPVGASWTNTFSITNNGNETLNISGVGISDARFEIAGLPATVAAGGASEFTVRFAPDAAGGFAGTLTISNDSPTAAYVVNLAGSCFAASMTAGPLGGGNAVTFTNGNFGTITNVLVGGVAATILDSGASWVTVAMPAAGAAGAVDVVVQTSDNGETVLANAYAYNPAGEIGGTAYGPYSWTNLGSGLSATGGSENVFALACDGTRLYAGGGFTNMGGVTTFNVAMWDPAGGTWTNLGSGLGSANGGYVYDLAHDGTNLYAGGTFTNAGAVAANHIAMWNGTTWTNLGTGVSVQVFALAFGGTNLYCGYDRRRIPANMAGVGTWNGTTWSNSEAGFGAQANLIYDMEYMGGTLYAGGGFRTMGGVAITNLAMRNPADTGTWAGMGGANAGACVYTLAQDGTNLYAGGTFTNVGGVAANRIAMWNGASWTNLGSGVQGSSVSRSVHDGRNLYVAGVFTNAGGVAANRIAMWNGASWTNVGDVGTNFPGAVLAHDGVNLYAGGYFTNVGSVAANGVAKWGPEIVESSGVSPESGSGAGGYPVVITGTNLGNGADITNVTICGASASAIVSQSATQVVVTAGSALSGGLGDVRVQSTSFGETVKSNAFTYNAPGMSVLGTNGAVVASGDAAAVANGTKFATLPVGASWTNTFSITNNGNETLNISGVGISDARFEIAGMPASVAAGGASEFTVRFAPDAAGSFAGSLTISNDSPTAAYAVNLAGSCFAASMTAGPLGGGNAVTFTNGNFGTITNVRVGGVAATILDSGASWFTVILPAAGAAGTVDVAVQTSDNGETVLANAYAYNPAGWIIDSEILTDWSRWGEVEGMPGAMRSMDAAVLNGKIHVGGGQTATILTNFYAFDGTNWQNSASFPAVRRNVAFAVLNGTLYSIGGHSAAMVYANVYAFNGTTWSSSVSLPAARTRMSAGVLNGKIYAVGGNSSTTAGTGMQTNVYAFDGTNWTEVAGLPLALEGMAVEELNGQLYSIGGGTNGVTNVFRFDGTEWTAVAGLPEPRSYMGSAAMDGKIYAVGGLYSWARTNVYAFDGTNWTETAPLPAARRDLAAAELGGHVYAIGGAASFTATNTVFEYPTTETVTGVMPSSGSWTGGYGVVITGTNFGNGADITNVTLCGVAATITNQTDRRVWVRAALGAAGLGDVVVQSTSCGTTVKSNAFEYLRAEQAALAFAPASPQAYGKTNALAVSGGSGTGAVSYAVTAGPGTIIGNTNLAVTAGSGTITVVATKAQDDGYFATAATATVAAAKADQTIADFLPTNGSAFAMSASAGLSASASSGLPATFAVASGPATLAGGTNLSFTGAGAVVVVASQAGDANWNPAPAATNTYVATKAPQAIVFDPIPPQKTTASVGLSALGGGSGNPVAFSVVSGPGSLAGGTNLTFGGPGDVAVVASQTGDGDYEAAADVTNVVKVFSVAPDIGPFAGGNVVTFTNGNFGTITNVLVGGAPATILDSGTSWFTVAMPAAGAAETVDVVVQTSDNGETTLADAYAYRPAGQIGGEPDWSQWVEVAGLPTTRFDMGAGVLSNRIYGVGGANDSGVGQTNVYCYDGTSWTEVPGLPAARFQAVAGEVNGALIVAGGSPDGSSSRTNVYRFTGAGWEEVAGMPNTFWDMAGATYAGAFYVIGGGYYGPKTNVYRFDGTSWTEVAGLPAPRDSMGAAACGGYLYAVAGVDSTYGENFSTNVYRYDGTNWTEVAGLPAPRGSPGVAARDGALFVAGGQTEEDVGFGMPMPVQHTNVYRFDETGWTEVAGLPRAWGNLLLANPNDALYAFGGSPMATNTYRYPASAGASGVEPASGSWTGGYAVVISGTNLCDGTLDDVTNVTLCGVAATILSQNATQVVVRAGAAAVPGRGDVRVFSTGYGETAKIGAFTYEGAAILVSGAAFGPLPLGAAQTNVFTVTNSGTEALTIAAAMNSDAGAAAFNVSALAGLTVQPGTASNVPVVFTASAIGTFAPTCHTANNSPVSGYTFGLHGSVFQLSVYSGPQAGGNVITVTNGSFGSITNVRVGGVGVVPVASGANWFTIIVPAAAGSGTVDIVVQTSDNGETTLPDAYTYNPPGQIGWTTGSTIWTNLGSGLNGTPLSLVHDGANLYAGGMFTQAGGQPANRVAMWNGTSWTNLGTSLDNNVYGLSSDGTNLYAVGSFGWAGGVAASYVAKWNGTSWSSLGSGLLGYNAQGVLCVGSDVYVVGGFTNAGGVAANYVAKWDGTSWTNLGSGLNTSACCLAHDGTNLYVGGQFTNAGGVAVMNVAKWDGTSWSAMGSGIGDPSASVYDLQYDGTYLYACGMFWDGGGKARVAKWDGSSWTDVGGGVGDDSFAMAHDGTNLYAGGKFTTPGSYVAKWNGTAWSALGSGVNSTVWSLAHDGTALYAGGQFSTAGGIPAANIAMWAPTVATNPGVAPLSGSWTGGYEVVILGYNLGNGTDITSVTLGGVAASIQSQNATQVVVVAGAAAVAGQGDVVVQSTSYGTTVKSNAFEYLHAEQAALAFAPASPQTVGTTNGLAVSGGSGTGAVSYAVTAGPGAIVGGTNLAVTVGTGTITVVATKAQDDLYLATAATATVAAAKADQTIELLPVSGTAFILGESTTVSVQASSGFVVALTNLTSELAVFNEETHAIVFTNSGVVRMVAYQEGDSNWNAAAVTNEWRVGGLITNVAPAAANVGGGIEVTIQGIALGDGTDVASVALCGVAATIVTQSANAVTVLAEAAPGTATGDVEVASGTGGFMVLSNAFEYLWLDAPVQLAPTNVLLDRLTARWQAVSNATAYFLEAGRDANFAAHVPGYEFLDAGAATNAQVDGLLDETPYWLRVFAWNDHGLSWASLVERVVTPAVNAADYDGDGQGELATFAATNAAWNFRSYRVDSRWDAQYGWSATVPVPADYDGDGRADLAVYHPAAGDWYIQPSAGGADRREHLGSAAAAPVPGDYDGDGRADLAVFDRTNGGRWSFRCSTDGDYDLSWGWSAVVPAPADYDGDGRTDVAVYHPASGNWYLVDLSGRRGAIVPQVVPWGWASAVPVPADYDGDGQADVAVFHRASATWYVRYSGGGSLVLAFGWPAVVPVPADYDGDGLADLAVYHAASGNWYVRQSSDSATVVKALGGPGQAPTGLYPQIHSWYRLP